MSYASTVAGMPGVVAHWTLDETTGTFADSVGSHTLAITGSPTRGVTALLSDGGKAVSFPGTGGNRLSTTSSSDFTFGTGDFWIAVWFQFTAASKVMLGGAASGSYIFTNSNGTISVSNNGATVLNTAVVFLNDGATHFVCFSRVSGTISSYIDGASTAQSSTSAPGSLGISGDLALGDLNVGGFELACTLDGVAIGKGSGLSGSQAAALYTAGTSSPSLAAGTLSVTGHTSSTVSLAMTAATSGTSPYTYQLQRAPDVSGSPGTFANDGSAQTGQTSSATFSSTGLTGSTTYWYRVVVTDAASATANSNQVSQATSSSALSGLVMLQGTVTPTTVPMTFSGITAGTSPYSTQLWRSATSGFTPPGAGTSVGSAVTGVSGTLTDSSPPSGVSFYRAITTDSAGSPATILSPEVPAASLQAALVLGFIGDSITLGHGLSAGQDPPSQLGPDLAARFGPRSVTISNQAVTGTTTTDWISTGANLPGARTAMVSAGVTHCHIMLGTNDILSSNLASAATYKSNLQNIIAYLSAASIKVIISYPIFLDLTGSFGATSFTSTGLNLAVAYQAQIDSLVDNVTVFAGDKLGWQYFADNRSQFQDGVHPTATGAVELSRLWGPPVAKALGLVPAGAGVVAPIRSNSWSFIG